MKAIKIFGGIVFFVVAGFVAYAIYLFSQVEKNKRQAQTANARRARWQEQEQEEQEEQEEDFNELTILQDGNEKQA